MVMKSLTVQPLTIFCSINERFVKFLTALAVELYLFFSADWVVSRYPNLLYLSYSEENPDSFMAGQAPFVLNQN